MAFNKLKILLYLGMIKSIAYEKVKINHPVQYPSKNLLFNFDVDMH
jgi:hypothetical protein